MSNHLRTAVLLTALSVLFIFIGRALGGEQGMVIAFMFAIIMNVGAYWFSDKIVLKMYQAQLLDTRHPIYSLVRGIAQNARMPMPRVYWMPSMAPNAFATGRNPQNGVVVVTEGLVKILNAEELKGVLAHEMGHIKNRDTLISCIAATVASSIVMLANMAKWAAIFGGHRRNNERGSGGMELLFMAILAPLAATLIQMAISRSREFQADATGAHLAGGPFGLIEALKKISHYSQQVPMFQASPATAHMFIVNPLNGSTVFKLFSTHPPLEERIEKLKNYRSYL